MRVKLEDNYLTLCAEDVPTIWYANFLGKFIPSEFRFTFSTNGPILTTVTYTFSPSKYLKSSQIKSNQIN